MSLIYLLFRLCWAFSAACEFSLFAGSGGYSPVGAQGLLTAVASGSRVAGSVVVNTGSAAPSMWNLPEPGTEPVSPASAGRLPTTGPPKKSQIKFFIATD